MRATGGHGPLVRHLPIVLLFIFLGLRPTFAQDITYQELCERAYRAADLDSLTAAIDYLRLAIELEDENPRNAILYAKIGAIQRRRGLYVESLEAYNTALERAPLATSILMERGDLNLELDRLDAARTDYSSVIELEEDNKRALLARAYIYMQQRDYRSSRNDYRRLLRLDPFNYSGRLGLATLEQRAGNASYALELLDRMIVESQKEARQTDAQRATVYIVRAGVEVDLDMPDAALLDLEIAIQKDPTQAEAYLTRGQIYLSQNKKTRAREDFERAIAYGIPREEMAALLHECN